MNSPQYQRALARIQKAKTYAELEEYARQTRQTKLLSDEGKEQLGWLIKNQANIIWFDELPVL